MISLMEERPELNTLEPPSESTVPSTTSSTATPPSGLVQIPEPPDLDKYPPTALILIKHLNYALGAQLSMSNLSNKVTSQEY